MKIVTTVPELQREIRALREEGKSLAFVPTMGALHAGHRRLLEVAHDHAEALVASVYVNPLQFGPREDFAAYPRTPEDDHRLCEQAGVDILFEPEDAAMYPRGRAAQTVVEVPGISDILCGASRPGHFRGVATVVNRLFNLVRPDVALFGKKDYQQLLVIRLMVQDLGMPVGVVGVETVREPDGLAMSSRNRYLREQERERAPQLYRILQELRAEILQGQSVPEGAEARAAEALRRAGFEPEYVSVRRQRDLQVPATGDRELVILAAARLGPARLIDNLEVGV